MTYLKIVRGNFYEGEKVKVIVNDNEIERKVHYSASAGDLYIVYKNNKYFYYEFMNQEME